MGALKISSKFEEAVWEELREFAAESHQSISGLLTQAIREFLQRKRVRPEVLGHLRQSVDENREPGELLGR